METLWSDAAKSLQQTLNAEMFTRWIAPIQPVRLTEEEWQLGVANEFYQFWLQDNFLPLISEAVLKTTGKPVRLKIVVAGGSGSTPAKAPAEKKQVDPAPVSSCATVVPSDSELKLNPRYTFDSFIVGPNNNFAHAAALAVAQAPGKAYNPLFIYGGVGLGKTHLMQAIGHYVALKNRSTRVCYITSEQFTNEFIQAIQNNAMTKFRKKYRQVDVLLIDDIQFLAGRERIQEEFFHTFNTLFDSHKQIVLSSDRPASEIANLEHRLVSRFEWGLVTEMELPALETRIAILRKKAESLQINIPDTVIQFIAERIRTNIRRLEGALIRVAAYTAMSSSEMTVQMLETLLRDALQEEGRRTITVDAIQKRVAEHFDIRLADMTSRRRPKNVAFPRQVAMYLSRALTDQSLSNIGESFGGRDHGTVMHACRLIDSEMAKDQRLRQTISYLQQTLQRGEPSNNR
jgi:chromosomal replication initiator protein